MRVCGLGVLSVFFVCKRLCDIVWFMFGVCYVFVDGCECAVFALLCVAWVVSYFLLLCLCVCEWLCVWV